MFENVIGHAEVLRAIESAITTGSLPPAVLLSGPRFGAKSTIALEAARAITCHGDGAWGCTCPSCVRQRSLQHQSTLFVGPRSFALDIHAAIEAYRREPRTGTRFLLIRAVRRLTRRFDPILWEDRRLKDLEGPVGALEIVLEDFEMKNAEEQPEEKAIREIETRVKKLLAVLPHDLIPVSLVRALASWAHTTGGSGNRVVIIEEAHSMSDAARNAMLKTLEEPPPGITFLLTSSRRSAIIPTILSRIRTYEIPMRGEGDQREVLRRIFRLQEPLSLTLREFFLSFRGEIEERYRALARTILAGDAGIAVVRRELKATVLDGDSRENAQYLLETIGELARRRLAGGGVLETQRLSRIGSVLDETWNRIGTRNMSPALTIEALAIAMKEGLPA